MLVQEDVTNHIKNLYYHLNDFIEFTTRYNLSIQEEFGIKRDLSKSSSELINIRDAFMHFILYYDAEKREDTEKAKEQWYYIIDHGQRAAKDQFVFFLSGDFSRGFTGVVKSIRG